MAAGTDSIRARSGGVIAVLVIVLFAGWVRFSGIEAGLPHLMTRPDEVVVLNATRHPASGSWQIQYPGAYHPGIPGGWIFLQYAWTQGRLSAQQALGAAPEGEYLRFLDRAPARLMELQRELSATLGVLTVLATMWVARRESGALAALVAGALVAASYLQVRDSHSSKPDVGLSLACTVALGAIAGLMRLPTVRAGAVAGALVGLAMSMKPTAVMLLGPLYVAVVWATPAAGWRRFVPAAAVAAGLAAAATFLVTSPDLAFHPETRARVLRIVESVFVSGAVDDELPENLAGQAVSVPLRPPGQEAANTTVLDGYGYYYGFALRYGLGLVWWLLVPPLLVWGVWSGRPVSVVSALFAVVSFLVLAASPAHLSRYMTPVIPALALVVADALRAATEQRARSERAALIMLVATLLLAVEPGIRSMRYAMLMRQTDTRLLATQWLRDNLPKGARVGIAGTVFHTWGEPWIPPRFVRVPARLDAEFLASAELSHLILHDHPLFASHVDPAALAAVNPRLRLAADFDPFVGPRTDAVFDAQDAYYVPIDGFGAVDRPGPQVRIYTVE